MDKKTSPISGKKQLLIQEGLFTVPSSRTHEPRLIGSECMSCGEIVFPRQPVCPNCQSNTVKERLLGPRGRLYTFTNVNHPVPEAYKGPIPYGVGIMELPEGVRIISHLTESNPEKLKVGMEMMLVIEKLFEDDEGNQIIGFKFKPI